MALALILSMGTFVYATSTTTATMYGLTMQFGDPNYDATPPESNMRFTANSTGFAVSYENGISNYYPDRLAFYVTAGQDTITDMTGSGITIQPSTTDNDGNIVPSNSWTTGFYILYINTATSGTKTLTISVGDDDVVLTFTVPTLTSSSGSFIDAYLPAPGQFTNEGITVGGWGDAYDANGNLKGNSATGVCLGYFGGYVVFDMGPILRGDNNVYQSGGIYNSSVTPYGTDFILFGNAFWGNSEPGCVQVSQNGSDWYDIAGNLYYSSNSVAASIIYTNPDPAADALITTVANNSGTRAAVSYTGTNLTGNQVATNTFHNHAWFPLNVNYFSARNNHAELSHADDTNLPFVSRTTNQSGITTTLTLTGQRLNTKATADLQFGYVDVHPYLTLGGTVSYNPYTPNTSTSTWSTISSGTSGGDPIDISWAVTSSGAPAKLDAIRYIRVYTGNEMDNPPFGEVSTEVCGISVCTGTANGDPGTPTITVTYTKNNEEKTETITTTNGDITPVKNLGSNVASITVSGTGYIYVNGSLITSGNSVSVTPTSGGTKVQVIVQNGTAAPYITWLNLKTSL